MAGPPTHSLLLIHSSGKSSPRGEQRPRPLPVGGRAVRRQKGTHSVWGSSALSWGTQPSSEDPPRWGSLGTRQPPTPATVPENPASCRTQAGSCPAVMRTRSGKVGEGEKRGRCPRTKPRHPIAACRRRDEGTRAFGRAGAMTVLLPEEPGAPRGARQGARASWGSRRVPGCRTRRDRPASQ